MTKAQLLKELTRKLKTMPESARKELDVLLHETMLFGLKRDFPRYRAAQRKLGAALRKLRTRRHDDE